MPCPRGREIIMRYRKPVAGDKIAEFKGRTVRTIDDVNEYLSKKLKGGDTITLTVERDGSSKEITVMLGEGL